MGTHDKVIRPQTLEELLNAQADDDSCMLSKLAIKHPKYIFTLYIKGTLFLILEVDKASQQYILTTMHKEFYWRAVRGRIGGVARASGKLQEKR